MSQNWLDLPDINNYKLLIMCECINDTFRKLLQLKLPQEIYCSIKRYSYKHHFYFTHLNLQENLLTLSMPQTTYVASKPVTWILTLIDLWNFSCDHVHRKICNPTDSKRVFHKQGNFVSRNNNSLRTPVCTRSVL